jgi:hypothetical protein
MHSDTVEFRFAVLVVTCKIYDQPEVSSALAPLKLNQRSLVGVVRVISVKPYVRNSVAAKGQIDIERGVGRVGSCIHGVKYRSKVLFRYRLLRLEIETR